MEDKSLVVMVSMWKGSRETVLCIHDCDLKDEEAVMNQLTDRTIGKSNPSLNTEGLKSLLGDGTGVPVEIIKNLNQGDQLPLENLQFMNITVGAQVVETFRRMNLLKKRIGVMDFSPCDENDASAFARKNGRGVFAAESTIYPKGGYPIDKESVEVLKMLDLIGKPLKYWSVDAR